MISAYVGAPRRTSEPDYPAHGDHPLTAERLRVPLASFGVALASGPSGGKGILGTMLSAIIGGAIGTVLGFVLGQVGRIFESRTEVRIHEREAAERNEQLRIWVDDETQSLVRHLAEMTERHAAANMLYSSVHLRELALRKADSLHRYRDEEARARLDIAALRDAEGVWHRRWRVWLKLPEPELTAAADVQPFLDRWREPVTLGNDSAAVLDRTTRTYTDALAELPTLKLS